MSNVRIPGSRRSGRRGATVVEFAIVASVFFVFVFGIIEFGRAMMVVSILANATQQGARTGVLNGAQSSDVSAAVNDYLESAQIANATVTVTPNPPSSARAGEYVTVTASLAYSQVSWLPAPWYLANKTLTATSIMRRESGQ